MAFVVASATGSLCPELDMAAPDIRAFAQGGGKVIMSFGGANGPYLEEAAKSPESLFGMWEEVIKKTGTQSFDFDVEGGYITREDLNSRRVSALLLLQKKYPAIEISYTLAVIPPDQWGNESLPQSEVDLLKRNISAGVRIDRVNIMTMDYGGVGQGKKHGDMAIACLESLVRQLGKLYPGRRSGDLYKMVGVTPMIGTNDDASVFGLADAHQLTKYARDKKIGLLSYWALQRDQVGKGSLPLYSQQNERDFQFFMAFNNAEPVPTTIPPYSPNAPSIKPSPVAVKPVVLKPVARESVPLAWQSGVSYKVGDAVNHLGRGYICTVPHRSQPGWSPEKPSALWSAA
jgi:carbohydrate binding protein with CBM5/12 domain